MADQINITYTHATGDIEFTTARKTSGLDEAIKAIGDFIRTLKAEPVRQTARQVRRVINHIRVHGIIPCVASSPKGFFVASNEIEMSECIGTLESLADAIQEVIEALRGQMYNKFGFRL